MHKERVLASGVSYFSPISAVNADIGLHQYRVSMKSAPMSVSISEYTDIGAFTPISAFGKNPDVTMEGTSREAAAAQLASPTPGGGDVTMPVTVEGVSRECPHVPVVLDFCRHSVSISALFCKSKH
jgi:hypothetical protein